MPNDNWVAKRIAETEKELAAFENAVTKHGLRVVERDATGERRTDVTAAACTRYWRTIVGCCYACQTRRARVTRPGEALHFVQRRGFRSSIVRR